MVRDLPEDIQNQVKHFLHIGNFVAAKQLHDGFFERSVQSSALCEEPSHLYDEKG